MRRYMMGDEEATGLKLLCAAECLASASILARSPNASEFQQMRLDIALADFVMSAFAVAALKVDDDELAAELRRLTVRFVEDGKP